jgi:thioredoxin-related protein
MKQILLLSVIFLLTLFTGSCKKEPICACGVEHPEENLTWLKSALAHAFSVNVFQFFIADIEYIEIADFPGPDSGSIIYDCEGNFVCELGGYLPGDNICNLTCPPEVFLPAYSKKKLIYSKRFNPD